MAGKEFAVQVEGLRELQSAVSKADKGLGKKVREINKGAAEIVRDDAEPYVPVRSGRMRATLKVQAGQRDAKVKVGSPSRVPYAGVIHWGWPARNIAPQNFLEVGLARRADDVGEFYGDEMREFVDTIHTTRR